MLLATLGRRDDSRLDGSFEVRVSRTQIHTDTQCLAQASSRVCGKSRPGRAFGLTPIRWIVCLRTASMEWNVPGKYGPHGELVFFLIQKEPATVPDGETFSLFINATAQ